MHTVYSIIWPKSVDERTFERKSFSNHFVNYITSILILHRYLQTVDRWFFLSHVAFCRSWRRKENHGCVNGENRLDGNLCSWVIMHTRWCKIYAWKKRIKGVLPCLHSMFQIEKRRETTYLYEEKRSTMYWIATLKNRHCINTRVLEAMGERMREREKMINKIQ